MPPRIYELVLRLSALRASRECEIPGLHGENSALSPYVIGGGQLPPVARIGLAALTAHQSED
jgi:hypothetical protein